MLFEAKTRKLLRQDDWASLARATPPLKNHKALHGRDGMGKRKKISNQNALTIREGPQAGIRKRLGGAHQNHDIDIRIGDDALTDWTAVQTPSQARESVSSYDVLAGNVNLCNAALHSIASRPRQGVDSNTRRLVIPPAHFYHVRELAWSTALQSKQLHYTGESSISMHAGQYEASYASPDDRGITTLSAEDKVSSNETGEGSKYCITQQAEDTACSLRLTSDDATDLPSVASSGKESLCNLIGEANHDHYPTNAAVTELGNVQMETRPRDNAEFRHCRIVDEDPWLAFLPLSATSPSLSVAGVRPALNRTHDRPPMHAPSDSASWSQRATRGARTLGDASLYGSPSLPSITPKGNQVRNRAHMGTGRLGFPKAHSDGNDKFWHRIVFGSDKLDSQDGEREITQSPGKVGMDERRSAQSVAVSRSSSPFDPLHGPGFCVSDSSTQAAATRAPPLVTSSGSMLPMTNSSAAPHSRRQGEGGSRQSGDAGGIEESDFGLQSVTQTSMYNNVSNVGDANSSQIL